MGKLLKLLDLIVNNPVLNKMEKVVLDKVIPPSAVTEEPKKE
jgi:hypothetical protein